MNLQNLPLDVYFDSRYVLANAKHLINVSYNKLTVITQCKQTCFTSLMACSETKTFCIL